MRKGVRQTRTQRLHGSWRVAPNGHRSVNSGFTAFTQQTASAPACVLPQVRNGCLRLQRSSPTNNQQPPTNLTSWTNSITSYATTRTPTLFEGRYQGRTRGGALKFLKQSIGRKTLNGLVFTITEIPVPLIREIVAEILAGGVTPAANIVPITRPEPEPRSHASMRSPTRLSPR